MHVVFITGCGTGFGHLLATRLLIDGHRVVATDPDASGLRDRLLAASGDVGDRLLVCELDVRDADAVAKVAAAALGWAPVDVVVNNAGYAIFGSQEEADLEDVRDLFDVNVLGPARVTQAFLPTLRDNSGTVVQLSSVAGRTVFPESGFYAATKYAVEAMSEALFQEACTFGVRVRLIEPGSFATQFQRRASEVSRPRTPDSPYAAVHSVWDDRKQAVLEPPQDPAAVVAAIVASLDDPMPFLRVPVGPDAVRILGLRDALGPDVWSRFAAERVGLQAADAGDVLSPGEVLGRPDPARLQATLAALHFGHLEHWRDDPLGVRALAVLGSPDRDRDR